MVRVADNMASTKLPIAPRRPIWVAVGKVQKYENGHQKTIDNPVAPVFWLGLDGQAPKTHKAHKKIERSVA